MSKIDDIFCNRLERIREELNSYISLHLPSSEHKPSPPSHSMDCSTVEEKKGSLQDSFLHYMKLSDEADDYFDEVDECLSAPTPAERKAIYPQAPRKASSHIPPTSAGNVPTGTVKIPDFLRKDRERTELDKVLEKKEESFSEMLLRMIDEKGLKDSDVYKRANIDRRLFSKIRADGDYVPSRKTAISFCLALQLELEEAKKLLATAGYTLSASSRFDLIIMYLIENCEYNIHFANIVLDDYGEGTLSR